MLVHELGHFLAAKWVGIKVEQFAVGFGVEPDLDVGVVGHLRQPRGVAVDRQALVGVVEVPVVERVPHREAGDDRGGQLGGVGLPLLGGVALDERLVERPADQRDRLLLEVGGLGGVEGGAVGFGVDTHEEQQERARETIAGLVRPASISIASRPSGPSKSVFLRVAGFA